MASSLSSVGSSRMVGSVSAWYPRWIIRVASPPSSTTRVGPEPSGQVRACLVHHQYSSRDSPFQAKTGTPVAAMAAAAWSWVEKMLHEAQRTSAPSSTRVSMSTAVCTVMWRLPVMRAPARGLDGPYFSRVAMSPGISFSAISISRRPKSASPMSLTLNSSAVAVTLIVIPSLG